MVFADDGIIPNSKYPLLVYRKVFTFDQAWTTDQIERELKESVSKNHWNLQWVWFVYKRPHYHSTAHEGLVCIAGEAIIQFGGPRVGKNVTIQKGDAVLIPAGVGHQCVSRTTDFRVAGIYPDGQVWDMCWGKPSRVQALGNIPKVPNPQINPFCGNKILG